MADHAERHQAEKIEAAHLRAAYAEKIATNEIRRVTMQTRPEDLETRSRYTPRVSISTVAAEIIDRWPGSDGNGASSQQGGNTSANTSSDKPGGQQSKDH